MAGFTDVGVAAVGPPLVVIGSARDVELVAAAGAALVAAPNCGTSACDCIPKALPSAADAGAALVAAPNCGTSASDCIPKALAWGAGVAAASGVFCACDCAVYPLLVWLPASAPAIASGVAPPAAPGKNAALVFPPAV